MSIRYDFQARELSGFRHELVWMPTRVKLGRYLALAALAVFALTLWSAGQ